MNIFLIYQKFIDEVHGLPVIGGLQTYMENLAAFAGKSGYSFTVLQRSVKPFTKVIQSEGPVQVVGVVQKHKNWTVDQVAEAERRGDPEKDLLIFGTSTQIVKHTFRRSLAVQHGIYWDVPTIHGKKPFFPLDVVLRSCQAIQQISWHRKVSRMICVDYNYVNWLRTTTIDRRLAYTVIPNFSAIPELPEKNRDGLIRLIFARRFETIRGVDIILELLPRLLARYPQLRITLAGGGSQEDRLKKRFGGDDRISFVCYVPAESMEHHKDKDIAIVPTIGSEGTSLSLLEAMASGCAVVCSDVGGMSNLVLDGYNGRMVSPDPDAFEQAVSELIENPALRRKMAEKGRETVESSFSLEAWQHRWARVLKEMEEA